MSSVGPIVAAGLGNFPNLGLAYGVKYFSATCPSARTTVLTQHDPRTEFGPEHRGGLLRVLLGPSIGAGPLLLTLVLRSLNRRQVLRRVDRDNPQVGRFNNM